MMDIGPFAAPPWLVVLFGVAALVGGVVIYWRGHNYLMVPIIFSIGWITMGYFFYAAGSFDIDDLGAMVRSGFIVLCSAVIAGGIISLRGKLGGRK